MHARRALLRESCERSAAAAQQSNTRGVAREQGARANEELRAAIERRRRLLGDAAREAWGAKHQLAAAVPARIQRELERGHALLAKDWDLLLRMRAI